MEHLYYIALGSNEETEQTLCKAKDILKERFPSIRYSRLMRTPPIGLPCSRDFYNQTACIQSSLSEKEVISILKETERTCGRSEEEKKRGRIRIDLDLVQADAVILRPSDMERDYIRTGIDELRNGH